MAHYTLFHGDLAPAHNNGSLTSPATRTSNATTPLPSYTAAQPYRISSRRRPQDGFIIFCEEFLAKNKNILPRQQAKVNRIARAIWRELSDEQQLVYETLARLEREAHEGGNSVHASQRRVPTGSNGVGNSRVHRGISSQSAVDRSDPLGGPAPLDMSAHASSYRAPNIAPTAAPEIPRDQLPTSSLMNSNTDPVFLDVHATQGQGMVDTYHGQATQGRLTSHQWPASASISTTVAETFVSDSQIPSPVYYYRDASGQSFAIMNQTAIPQYRSSAPTVAPIARHPDPVATSLTYHQLDDNTYDQGWGESSTYTSASSSLEVGTSNYGGGSIQGEGSSAYYGHPAENTWDGFQESQHQF